MSETPLYRRADAPLEQRVEDLLGRMTLEEKLGQINMPPGFGEDAPKDYAQVERLVTGEQEEGLGPVGGFFGLFGWLLTVPSGEQNELAVELQRRAREQTRLGVPLLQIAEGCHGVLATGTTIFPEGPGLGSTWDPQLIEDVFHVAAREARATGMHMLCTLVVEPFRDPRMGRLCEALGEDPLLTRELARAIVAGCQGDGDLTAGDRVGAALTNWPTQCEPVSGMERGAVELSERNIRMAHLPPWWSAGPGGAIAVMASYAAIDGVPAHGSEYWMSEVLRDELGFDGIVLSEGFGFETLIYEGIVETQKEAGVLGLKAGVDVNITHERAFLQPLLESVREGLVSEELLDRAVRRVLAVKFRMGLFEEPAEGVGESPAIVRAQPHLELAERVAREGIVLLRNEGGALPLAREALKRVAVIGPNADDAQSMLGDYVVHGVSQPIVTVLEGLRAKLGDGVELAHVRGCDVTDLDDAEIDAAVAAAAGADVAICVLGERSRQNYTEPGEPGASTVGEPFDVVSLDLSGRQEELLRAVHATGTPVVLVLVNGRPLSINWADEHVPAILEAWLPGERGGHAVADVLLGDADPEGRLTVTFPRHAGQLPAYYNSKPSKRYWISRGGGVDGDGRPLYPFGYGLTYTRFDYEQIEVEQPEPGAARAEVSVRVRNVGERAGAEVVQLYVGDRFSSAATPSLELRGFEKVRLGPGEAATVRFALGPQELALLDARQRLVVEPGVFDLLVGASCEDVRLRVELHVTEELQLPGRIPLAPAA
jgi:beta-glucosidase